jgi:hypothetical protein
MKWSLLLEKELNDGVHLLLRFPSPACDSVSMKWSLLLEKELDDGVHLLL